MSKERVDELIAQMDEVVRRSKAGEITLDKFACLSLPLQLELMKITHEKLGKEKHIKSERDLLYCTVQLLIGFISLVELTEEFNEYCISNIRIH